MKKLNTYRYTGQPGELTPQECKDYFMSSSFDDWTKGDTPAFLGSDTHVAIIVWEEDGVQQLRYWGCPIAEVIITAGARGIVKNLHFEMPEDSDG